MIIQTSLRKNLGWQIAGGENNSLSGITAVLCNWSEFRLHPYASPPSWSELPWPDQTIQLLVGVLLCCVCVCGVMLGLHTCRQRQKKRDILLFYLKHSSCHQLNPSCIFPSFSTSFTLFFFLNCLLKSTHAVTPPPPLFFFFFFFYAPPLQPQDI